ncbi:DinB family protein [Francisellaceae bacterium]|nr:DinB family protein [Francisellaceae bacterium]
MPLKENFKLMASYNEWMNQNIYSAAASLSEKELHQNRGAFFGSIIGTLNHIMIGDIIWLKRFSDHPDNFKSLESIRKMEKPTNLNGILHESFNDLNIKRNELDNAITSFVEELTDDVISSPLSYQNTKGVTFSKKLGFLLQHFFNHQSHHRGQISTLCYQAGIDIGVTDLLACIPEEK